MLADPWEPALSMVAPPYRSSFRSEHQTATKRKRLISSRADELRSRAPGAPHSERSPAVLVRVVTSRGDWNSVGGASGGRHLDQVPKPKAHTFLVLKSRGVACGADQPKTAPRLSAADRKSGSHLGCRVQPQIPEKLRLEHFPAGKRMPRPR